MLKHTKNIPGDSSYGVNEQFPPEVLEKRKALLPMRKKMKTKGCRVGFSFDKLIVDGKAHTNKPARLSAVATQPLRKTLSEMKMSHTGQTVNNGSVFQGHATKIQDVAFIKPALYKLYENTNVASATHNIWAFRGKTGENVIEDHEDDGEHSASFRLIQLMRTHNIENCMLIVTRWKGGSDLGNARFTNITEVGSMALKQAGLIS